MQNNGLSLHLTYYMQIYRSKKHKSSFVGDLWHRPLPMAVDTLCHSSATLWQATQPSSRLSSWRRSRGVHNQPHFRVVSEEKSQIEMGVSALRIPSLARFCSHTFKDTWHAYRKNICNRYNIRSLYRYILTYKHTYTYTGKWNVKWRYRS